MSRSSSGRDRGRPLQKILLAALLVVGVAGCGGDDSPRRVFFLTVDTLRADHLGHYGYGRDTSPFLDRMAADSVVFERALVQWPKTGASFASMFTGQYPHTTGLTHKADIRIPPGYLTLPEFFREHGFTTVGVNSNGVLNTDLGWDRGFDEYLETRTSFGMGEGTQASYRGTMNADRVNELALPLLEKHQHAKKLFAWIHYSDPHTPYLLPPGVENPFLNDPLYVGERQAVIERPAEVQLDGSTDLKYYVAQYDANIRVVDQAIAGLVAHLAEQGLLESSLIVVTADHGESLGEHEYYFEHGKLAYNTTLRVPLIFHWPEGRVAKRRISQPVELVDLYPTLRDLVAPKSEVAGLEGQSLLPFLGAAPPSSEQLETFRLAFAAAGGGAPLTHFRTVQDERWQLVFHPARTTKKGEELPIRYELYDLEADPLAAHNLEGQHPEISRRLTQNLARWMNGRLRIQPPKGLASENSEATQKALKALGYL